MWGLLGLRVSCLHTFCSRYHVLSLVDIVGVAVQATDYRRNRWTRGYWSLWAMRRFTRVPQCCTVAVVGSFIIFNIIIIIFLSLDNPRPVR